MKLATLDEGARNGRPVDASRDHARARTADGIAVTLQDGLERWSDVEGPSLALANRLDSGDSSDVVEFIEKDGLAPLPRAGQWLDESAYDSHGALLQSVSGRAGPVFWLIDQQVVQR